MLDLIVRKVVAGKSLTHSLGIQVIVVAALFLSIKWNMACHLSCDTCGGSDCS